MPKVTVLLTSYNRPRMLGRAVDSVLAQTLADFELIVLDDNSPPGSGVHAVLAGCRDPRLWVLQSRVRDEDRARTTRYAVMINRGLGAAEGEYVTYLCDDDYYRPPRLQVLAAALDANPAWPVVYGPQLIVNADGTHLGVRPANVVLDDAAYLVDHCSVMHRRALAAQVGGWDTDPEGRAVGDARFWRRLNQAGHKFYPAGGEPLDVNVHHPGAIGQPLTDDQLIADRLAGRLI